MELIFSLGVIGWCLIFLRHKKLNERGGGEEAQLIQTPTTAAPSASESAESIYQAKLKYDPLTAAQDWSIQQQYVPQQAALYQSLYNQYYPQMAKTQQALQQELYPTQSKILEAGAASALERLQNPNYMTASEETAQTATRGKAVSDLQKAMRERANLGGGLYGGRAAAAETQSVSDMLNQFTIQDYTNRMNAAQQAQSALTPYMQILYPQIGSSQPQVSNYQYSSAVPSADTLYNAVYQSSQPNYLYQQGSESPLWGLGGQVAGGASAAMMAAMLASSKRYKKNIKLWAKH